MSYPYPQDRNRERNEKADQPYDDAKESLAESEAEIRSHAPREEAESTLLTEEERQELQEQQASERFRTIGEEVEDSEVG
jgi:hypothetical protein